MGKEQVLAIDIGGTSVKYGVVSPEGEITQKGKFKTGSQMILSDFISNINDVVELAVKQGIKKIGISSLGTFDKTGMCLGGVENLPFLEGINLPNEVKAKFPQMECRIINDGVAAAMGEYRLGEGQNCSSFICVTLGTGIGGAIVIEGKPILGSHFQSGEIGYSDYQGPNEYLEMRYSTKGVLKEAARQMQVQKIGGIEFTDNVKAGEPICSEIFQDWMEVLAKILANAVLLLDPEMIIIGGGISGEKEWICNKFGTELKRKLPAAFGEKICVKVAKNGNDAGLLGATAIFIQ